MNAVCLVRDAVIAEFNAAGVGHFGVAFTASAKWAERTDNTSTDLVVNVLPDGSRKERLTRNRQTIEVDLIVHVKKKLATDDVAEVDALAALLSLFEEYYYEHERVATIAASLKSSALQLPTRKQLNTARQFYGWVRLTFGLINAN